MSRRRGRGKRGRSYGGTPAKTPALNPSETAAYRDPKATAVSEPDPQQQTVAQSLGNGTSNRPIVEQRQLSGYGERLPAPELSRSNLARLADALIDNQWEIPPAVRGFLPATLIRYMTEKLPDGAVRGNGDDLKYSPRIRMMAAKLLATLQKQNTEAIAVALRAQTQQHSAVVQQVNINLPEAVQDAERRRTRVITDDDL